MNIEHIPTRAEIRARRERLGCYGAPEPMPEKLPAVVIGDDDGSIPEPSPPPRSNIWFNIVGDRPADFTTLADVRDAVCEHFGIDYLELCKRRQLKLVVYRRSIAIYLARELTTKSWPQIGRMFGGLDHTSAISAGRRVEAAIEAGDETAVADVSAIRMKLGKSA